MSIQKITRNSLESIAPSDLTKLTTTGNPVSQNWLFWIENCNTNFLEKKFKWSLSIVF